MPDQAVGARGRSAPSLEGRSGIVIGAETPAGGAIARAIGAAGASLGLAAMRADEGVLAVRRVQRELEAQGRVAATYAMDVTLGRNVQVTVRQMSKELGGRLRFIVSASDAPSFGPLARLQETEADRLLRLNFLSHLYAARAAGEELKRGGGGHLLFVVHALGAGGRSGAVAYASAHAATLALATSLADEWAGTGIAAVALVVGDPHAPESPLPAAAVGRHALDVLASLPGEVNGAVVTVPPVAAPPEQADAGGSAPAREPRRVRGRS